MRPYRIGVNSDIPTTSLLHPYYTPTTPLLHPYYIPTTSLLHLYYIPTTSLLHPSTPLLHPYYIPTTSLLLVACVLVYKVMVSVRSPPSKPSKDLTPQTKNNVGVSASPDKPPWCAATIHQIASLATAYTSVRGRTVLHW